MTTRRDSSPEGGGDERFRTLADQVADILAETDGQGRYLYVSPSFERILGWPAQELLGRLAFDLVHPEERDAALAVFARSVNSGAADEHVCRVATRTGDWRWLHVTGRPFRTAAGELRMGLIGRDIHDQRVAAQALRESERRFRVLVETATCGIVEYDRAGITTFANRAFAAMMGVPPEELVGRPAWEFEAEPADRERLREALRQILRHEPRPLRRIHRLRGRGDRRLSVEIDWNYKRDDSGAVTGFVSVVTDVTRREQSDAALAESHRFITRIAETSPSMLCVFDLQTQSLVYVNSRISAHLGWDSLDLHGMGANVFAGTVHPEDGPRVRQAIVEAARAEDDAVVEIEYRTRHAKGGWRWVHARFAVFARDEKGVPRQMLAAHEDVTERHDAVEALRVQEERFRLLAENAGDVILEFTPDGQVSFVSPSWTELTGHPVEPLRRGGLRWLVDAVLHPSETGWYREGEPFAFSVSGSVDNQVFRLRHANGEWRWFESRSDGFTTAEGQPRGIAIARDVTDRVRAEEALRTSEARFRLVAENAYDFITEIGPDAEISYLSPSFRDILGFDPEKHTVGDSVALIHPDDREPVAEAFRGLLRGRPLDPIVYRHRDARGEWRWLESYGRPRAQPDGRFVAVSITRDITDKVRVEEEARRLQEQLLQAQKLESLGVLAGGIAHDFNNLLVGILGNASLALSELPVGAPLRETLEGIETAALRAAELTNQMLAYSGKGRFVVAPLDLSLLVDEMAHLLEASISKKAVLRRELARDLPALDGDATQLRQLVMNLITNASDALGGDPGTIALRTRLVRDAARELPGLRGDGSPPSERAILLEVEDTGVGMDPQTRARIFDPFFTTKFTGRGLGLAAALGIVRGHRGAIDVHSEPGRGTRFRIVFPASASALAQPRAPLEPAPAAGVVGTVLVADDEEVVRRMATRILAGAGLEVLEAADGRAAVEAFRRHADRVGAVLLDLTMPHLSGEEALRAIREIRPDVPVVLTSGYSESEIALRFEGVRLEGFLQKPFRPGELLERVRAALEASQD